VSKVKVK